MVKGVTRIDLPAGELNDTPASDDRLQFRRPRMRHGAESGISGRKGPWLVRCADRRPFRACADILRVSFRRESELAEPLTRWLEEAGFDVRQEVEILGRRADLLGSRADGLAAIEMKMHDWSQALRQALAYQLAADRSWVAMPLGGASRAYRHRWKFEAQNVGLLAVDDAGVVRAPIPAGCSPRLLPFLREKFLGSRSCFNGLERVRRTS